MRAADVLPRPLAKDGPPTLHRLWVALEVAAGAATAAAERASGDASQIDAALLQFADLDHVRTEFREMLEAQTGMPIAAIERALTL